MKRLQFLLILFVGASLLIFGCNDDTDISPADHDVYLVTAVNAGNDMMSVSFSGQNQVFCYKSEGCETETGFTYLTIDPDDDEILMLSDLDRIAEGFILEVKIRSGERYLEITGFNYGSNNMEFNDGEVVLTDGEVVLTTDIYSEDETIIVEWGKIEGFEENETVAPGDFDHLAVFVVNTGSDDLDIEMSGDTQVNFCYEGSGCESVSGSTWMSVFEGGRMELDMSGMDDVAVGVIVQFEVTGGEGYAEVVAGEAYMDDGWPEFNEGSVVFTSDPFSDGQTVTFSWGETD